MLNIVFQQDTSSRTRAEIALINGKFYPYHFTWQGDHTGIQWGNWIAGHTVAGVEYVSRGYSSLASAKRALKSAGYLS